MSDPVRTTVSIPRKLYDAAQAKQKELGFSTFSDYIQHLMREELILRDMRAHTAADDSAPIKYPVPGRSKLPPGKRGIEKGKEN